VGGAEGEDEVRRPVQAPPGADADAPPQRERDDDQRGELGGDDAERDRERSVGREAGHEQCGATLPRRADRTPRRSLRFVASLTVGVLLR
jgi:hypothetical protein